MFVLANQLQRLPVISLQTGQTVAATGKPIINPDTLEVAAFVCQAKGLAQNNAVLLVQDIRRTSRDGILIDSVDEIEDASEIVRLKNLVEKRFELIGMPVVNESGQKLGRIEEYTVNLNGYGIQKLYLKQSPLKSLFFNGLVIDRSQIVDVTPKQITVRDATVKKPLFSPQPVRPPAP